MAIWRASSPFLPGPVRRNDVHRHATREGLPLQHGSHEQGCGVDPGDKVAHAGPAVSPLLRPEREPSPTHATRELAQEGPVQGQVRPGLGQVPRGSSRATDQAGHRSSRHQARSESCNPCRNGTASRPTRRNSMPGRWKCTRRSPSTRTTRLAAWSRALEEMGVTGQHAVLLHLRRQRRLDRRRSQRNLRRMVSAQRRTGGCALPALPSQ